MSHDEPDPESAANGVIWVSDQTVKSMKHRDYVPSERWVILDRSLLTGLQWAARRGIEDDLDCCPVCLGVNPHNVTNDEKRSHGLTDWDFGHRDSCWLAKAAGLDQGIIP
jgi:hypothetical protein